MEDGKIWDIDDFDKIMGESDEKIDLNGNFLLPGFIDSHTHLVEMGLDTERVDLSEEKSLDEAQYYLEKEAKSTDEGDWIIGVDFDETLWKKVRYPTKEDLDEVSEEHPIIIRRTCGHVAVANTLALERISEDWKRVDRETGLMREEPVWNIDEIMDFSKEERKKAIRRAIDRAHSHGITSVHEVVDRDNWEAYKELDEEESLELRVNCYIHFDESEGLEPTDRSEFLSLKGVKMYADGSIGGRTAALNEEYADDPGNKGILILSQEEMEEVIEDAEERDFQVMAHAIGDRAISTAIDAFENSAEKIDELRHRIEHAEMLWERYLRRIRDMNLVLSTQPNFAYKWSQKSCMNESRLGKERLQKCNPYWDIQRSLIKMAFGSDNMPMSPLFGIYSAINHPVLEQRISSYNALQSYITNGAYASREEDRYGSFKEGKLADFVVLSENPLDSENIKDIEVKMTVVGGKIVYDEREDL
ncbi:MAG: amidohydrolase [Candidatus Thermoplasmatota archaeon]|nr:amidohydrolase [Candidatus Thermoplasmatota archaeon]